MVNAYVMRFVFLLFIFVLAVYFSTKNETVVSESYVDAPLDVSQEDEISNEEVKPDENDKVLTDSVTNQIESIRELTTNAIETEEEEDDKSMFIAYNTVIGIYRDILGRKPSLDELEQYSEQLVKDTDSEDDLRNLLMQTEEYKRITRKQDQNTYGLASTPSWSHHQYVVRSVYKDVYGIEPNSDDLQFLVGKFRSYNEDETKLRKLVQSIRDSEFKSGEGGIDKNNKEYSYADIVNDRNISELKHASDRSIKSKKYEDLVLIPNQQWSVPQKHPPVCTVKKCDFQPLHDQTALIGTLLEDATNTEVGSIMPKFSYKEQK